MFFDGAETPPDWIVGERGQGRVVARSTFKAERNSLIGSAARTEPIFERLLAFARRATYDGGPALESPAILDRLAEIDGYLQAQIWSGYHQSTLPAEGEGAGVLALTNKLQSTNLLHRVAALASDLLGSAGLLAPRERGGGDEKWVRQILGALGQATAGGTSNIQRNIIARRGLRLPQEPD